VAADEPASRTEYENDFQEVFFDFICDNGSGSILYQVSITGLQGFMVNEIGPTGISSIEALVFVGNTLYATNAAGQEYTINTSTGAATLVASTTQPITAMGVPASTLSTLHTFTGGADGGLPFAGLILDQAGNLYGTAAAGGTGSCSYLSTTGCGTIFELKNHNGSWIFNPLYSFQGGTDGEFPVRPLTLGPNGTFYGTTLGGGEGTCSFNGASGCGVVFNAGPNPTPPRTPLLTFRESVLYRFTGASDGANPYSTVIFDQAGNMYGTTTGGGANGAGAVFELSPAAGGTYTETVLYSFIRNPGSATPLDGLIFDTAGNLYGTTENSGERGIVFELSPAGGGTWTFNAIHVFNGNGQNPQAGVAMDAAGNLYGTAQGSVPEGGVVWQITAPGYCTQSGYMTWTETNEENTFGYGRIALDSSGNQYVTLQTGGAFGYGGILELTNDCNYIDLYDFAGASDGADPYSGVVLDSSGNLYGTSESGAGTGCGGSGCGTVWKLTPTN
jgi:uncharacterized repeat protein (TIGR03803 family)